MEQIPRAEVLARLRLENPWWAPPHEVPGTYSRWNPRPCLGIFLPLLVNREVRRAIVLMGPRRVGKTFLIHHAIDRLIHEEKVPPTRICYVSIDNPIYLHLSLEQVLSLFSEATGTNVLTDESYVFFDEIQYLRAWEVHLKSLVDTFPNVKGVASGSAAAALRLKSNESGAGRFTDFLLPPVMFYEYLALTGDEDLVQVEGPPESRSFTTPDIGELNSKFVHYLNFGGYPEVIFSKAIQEDPGRFIKNDIVDKVLLRDLPSLYGIQDIQELNALFTSLAYNTAQELTLEDLATKSGVAKPTIKRYIEYLEAAFLIRTVRRIDQDAKHFKRARNFKVYLANSSMRTALFSPLESSDSRIGALVETGIFSQWFHSQNVDRLHYARWKEGEVDIVSLNRQEKPQFAIEVKWSDRPCTRPAELTEALMFCRKNSLSQLAVTTQTKEETQNIMEVLVRFRPAALYAFTLGYNIILSRKMTRSMEP
jgi:uncharacterized protein